ncbi:MAG: ABC transporter permease [Cytophagaceae bacterium]|nr:ABC transporter permease [Cytophagaceae bacterium]MBK9933951.1 ABC transporter permease [Cytophagaceae bacterium]MBL0300412.1 ABC transporter permease [Cytophagaceae bacterium]MBL0327340.1 ABC transporter permease [Cytophagaceae bacterium]
MISKERIITANKSTLDYIRDIWQSKELLWILAKRDILVKYKQTILGVGWSVFRPLITTIVMAFAFGKIGSLDTDNTIPFTLVVAPGVIVWLFFSQSLLNMSMSIVMNSNLVTKVFFPRLIIPLSTVFLGLVDVVISLGLFIFLCFYFQFVPDWKILLVPVFVLLTFFATFGIGLITAVLNVKFRDIGQIIPFIIQFGFFISPVGYLTSSAASKFSNPWAFKIFLLNPVTGCIDAMRWAMLGDFAPFNWASFIPLLIFIVITFFMSFRFFRKHENSFVDYI